MDIAALGAATQLQSGQRTQQAGMAGLKSAVAQSQSVVALLTNAVNQAKQVQTQTAAAPADQPAPEQSASERRLARGSIVNILA
jgi:peptidoglycan hydrolase CwlO-like protein